MTSEQLEFAITQYLDGTLPPEEVGALQARLESDPEAQALLAVHERLTTLLRSLPGPELDWSELAGDFSAVVTGTVDEAAQAPDQRLNDVLKAAPALPALRWDELTKRISTAVDDLVEAGSTASGVEDQRLDSLLRSSPMPAVDWERLAGHLSEVVGTSAVEAEAPAVIGRIGFARRLRQMAVAASVLLVGGVIAIVAVRKGGKNTHELPIGPSNSIVQVDTNKVELPNQPALAEIQIGPSPSYAKAESELNRRGVGVASRSPVVIVTPATPEDGDFDPEHAPGLFD
jgi:anti-sigma factor RsiW